MKYVVILGFIGLVGLVGCNKEVKQEVITGLVAQGFQCYGEVLKAAPECKASIPTCFSLSKSVQGQLK